MFSGGAMMERRLMRVDERVRIPVSRTERLHTVDGYWRPVPGRFSGGKRGAARRAVAQWKSVL